MKRRKRSTSEAFTSGSLYTHRRTKKRIKAANKSSTTSDGGLFSIIIVPAQRFLKRFDVLSCLFQHLLRSHVLRPFMHHLPLGAGKGYQPQQRRTNICHWRCIFEECAESCSEFRTKVIAEPRSSSRNRKSQHDSKRVILPVNS